MNFKRIGWDEARELVLAHGESGVHLVDVRDEQSFENGHVDSAVHLAGSSVGEFIASADTEKPVLVYCYHGNMSQSAAAYLAEEGFDSTYSIDGGYETFNEQPWVSG